jgi:hypothetical protein
MLSVRSKQTSSKGFATGQNSPHMGMLDNTMNKSVYKNQLLTPVHIKNSIQKTRPNPSDYINEQ